MRHISSMVVALAAGTVFSGAALAQKAPQQVGRRVVAAVPQRGRAPDMVRQVRIDHGVITGLSDWQVYREGGHSDASATYFFDAIQDTPGATPGTNPPTNRYILLWTAGGPINYTGSYRAHDMQNILPGGRGQNATIVDFLHYEEAVAGTPLFVAITTSESAPSTTATAPDPTWGTFTGIQLGWATGVGTGFWFTTFDASMQTPPLPGFMMPADGNGGYLFKATRDAAGTMPAQQWQTGLWGTGNSAQPPVARVGTQTNIEWTDDSTPPNCGAANLAQNIANGIMEGNGCENQAFTFAVPAPAPTNLATAVGFAGLPIVSNCYANCDGSTGTPLLTINDFVCFQSKFAAGDSYANCDHSTGTPLLTINDFVCFQSAFAAGCSAP